MDEDVKELTKLLAGKIKPEPDSKITIGAAVLIGVLASILGFLTVGYIGNANNIIRLQTEVKIQGDVMKEVQKSQSRIETLVTEIRLGQMRQYGSSGNHNKSE